LAESVANAVPDNAINRLRENISGYEKPPVMLAD